MDVLGSGQSSETIGTDVYAYLPYCTVNIDVNRNQFVRLATWMVPCALPMSSAASVQHRVKYLSARTLFGTIS